MSKKKSEQLGMTLGKARNRLVTDTLFRLATEAGHVCCRCGKQLTRDDFSIEHVEPWLDSEDPVGRYFDQENIAFSHLSCNASAARRPNRKSHTYHNGCRCDECLKWNANRVRKNYNPEKRRERYLRTGN